MANKPIQFSVGIRKVFQGKGAERKLVEMQTATPTGRERVDFRNFCERVGKATTFTPQEVAAVINYATEIAKDIVANGDIVEFGDLGTLTPSFVSKVVPLGEKFNANVHITKPVVRLRPSVRYFQLDGVSYERVEPRPKKSKEQGDKPGGNDSGNSGGSTPDTGGHAGI